MTADVTEFVGAMDEVKIFNYPLTADTIAETYYNYSGRTICVTKPEFDLNDDCKVDIADLAEVAGSWLDCGIYPSCVNTVN